MTRPSWSALVVFLATFLLFYDPTKSRGAEAEPPVDDKDLPRVPAVEPNQAIETFRIRPGFRIELVASEPLVVDPVALSFDENGRLFVVEMRDYSERRDEHLGRIRLLEDTDGDGRYDKSTIFADNIPWPTGVICSDGGVYVAATPDLLYFKDTDGDGVADQREVAFTGFGAGVERLNVQQLFNSLTWGLDNRIHGANGGNGGSISSPRSPNAPPLELRGRDFSFDPRTRQLQAESGGGQYGLSFDDQGRKFVCSNSSHIRAVMYEDRYAGHNPFFTLPPPSIDIAVDGPAAEVYRISPDEPWRVIRTKWRVSGVVPGLIEGGGRPSGYFTGATGITIYRGDAWPADFRGDAFVADCGSNLVHRKKVYPSGAGFKAERPADEQRVEFLASRDNWFRPVQMANAPDGTLYVIDMYREVIEHPWSLPPSLKRHLDLNSGNTRGRIYRVVPNGFTQPRPPHFGQASSPELVATLAAPNGWTRDTAARLLYERQDKSALAELKQLLASSSSPLARLHSLYALRGLGRLDEAAVLTALQDPSDFVRKHALRLSEDIWHGQTLSQQASDQFEKLGRDSSPEVCYQLAFTLGECQHPRAAALLSQILRQHADDPWIHAAVLSSANDLSTELFSLVLADEAFRSASSGATFLSQLALIIGARKQTDEITHSFVTFSDLSSTSLACALGNGLAEGIQRSGGALARLLPPEQMDGLLKRAHALADGDEATVQSRLTALQFLSRGPFTAARDVLRSMLQPNRPSDLQKASIRALSSFADPLVAPDLLQAWDGLTPSGRSDVIEALLRRPERVTALLQAVESGQLRRTDLSASQIDFLRKRPDPAVQERAAELLGKTPVGTRQETVKSYSAALNLTGHSERGQPIYLQRCSSCHRLAGQGFALGPDLETVRASGKESLLTNLLDPNREVMPKYVNYLAETKDGETFTGLVAMETDSSVVLRQPNGNQATLLRSNLQQMRSLGQSAMPEGLEEGLKAQDLADLMDYVLTATPLR